MGYTTYLVGARPSAPPAPLRAAPVAPRVAVVTPREAPGLCPSSPGLFCKSRWPVLRSRLFESTPWLCRKTPRRVTLLGTENLER